MPLARGRNHSLARRRNTTLAGRINRAGRAVTSFLGGVNQREAVLLLQDPLVAARVHELGAAFGQQIFGMWKLKQCFLGAQGVSQPAAPQGLPP